MREVESLHVENLKAKLLKPIGNDGIHRILALQEINKEKLNENQ